MSFKPACSLRTGGLRGCGFWAKRLNWLEKENLPGALPQTGSATLSSEFSRCPEIASTVRHADSTSRWIPEAMGVYEN